MHQDNLDPARRTHGLTAVPLFHAAWQFAAGIVLASRVWIEPPLLLVMLALVAALCGVAVSRDGRTQRIAWLPLAVLWMMLGAWCGEMEPQPAAAPELAALSDGLLRTVEGTVVDAGPVRTELEQNVDEPTATEPTQRIDLRVATVEVVSDESDAQAPVGGGVRLTVRWPVGEYGAAQDGAQGGAKASLLLFCAASGCVPWFDCCGPRFIAIRVYGAARIIYWTRELRRRHRLRRIEWSGWARSRARFWRAG